MHTVPALQKTRAATATDRLHASNVEGNTAVRLVQKVKIPQQNVRCVAGIVPPITKGCESCHNTIRCNNPYRIPQARQHTPSMQPITLNPYIPAPPQQPQQSRTYADLTSNRSQVTDDPITSLTKILGEFKGIFSQLLQQNGMILDMLSTLLNRTH